MSKRVLIVDDFKYNLEFEEKVIGLLVKERRYRGWYCQRGKWKKWANKNNQTFSIFCFENRSCLRPTNKNLKNFWISS